MPLIRCENPFDLTADAHEMELQPGESIGQALGREGLTHRRYVLTLDGEILPPERALEVVPPQNKELMLIVEPGNSALRTIAMVGVSIAAAAFAGPLGGFLASTLGVAAGSVTTAIAGALISLGGTLLVNGIASLFAKGPGGAGYGVLGPATTARSGIPVPKGYGKMRRAGNIVESWVDIQGSNGDAHDVDDGADTIGRQYINVRVDYGHGPARLFENLLLNGRDINEYQDVSYLLLYGTNDQGTVEATDPRWQILNRTTTGSTINTQPTTAFNTINNNYPQSQRVRCGVPNNYVVAKGKRTDTQKITVFVTFPLGVWRLDDSNNLQRLAIDYDVYYRAAGGGWQLAQHHYYYNIRQTLLRQATIIDNLAPGRYDIKVVKNGSGAVFNALDAFEHESNKFGDELWVESVQETSYTALAYPGKIQICLRFMATGQLSGSDVNLTADITHGLRNELPAEIADLPEDAPAAVAYDVAHDDVTGAGLPDSRIDLDFLRRWGDHTQTMVDDGDGGQQRLAVFNGVFEQDGRNVWDTLSTIAAMSYANLQRVGTKLTGWLDAPDVPVQMFHSGNIIRGSYDLTYLNLEDRAQEVQVDFSDANDDYKVRNPARVVRAANQTAIEALKKSRVSLLGSTSWVQSFYWAQLHLRELEDLLRTHKWQTNIQAVRARTGNVALLQRELPKWGAGGLLQPGSTTSQLALDRDDLTFNGTDTFSLYVLQPALQRAAVTITAVAGNAVTITGYDGTTQVLRLRQGDVDVAIRKATATQLTVDDVTGLSNGAATLWDLDVMEERQVSNLVGSVATLSAPLSTAPQEYAGYIYQWSQSKPLLVRIKNIRKIMGQRRYEITAIDYADTTYDLTAPPASTGGNGGSNNPNAIFALDPVVGGTYPPVATRTSSGGSVDSAISNSQMTVDWSFPDVVPAYTCRLFLSIATYTSNVDYATAQIRISGLGSDIVYENENTSRNVSVAIPPGQNLSTIGVHVFLICASYDPGYGPGSVDTNASFGVNDLYIGPA